MFQVNRIKLLYKDSSIANQSSENSGSRCGLYVYLLLLYVLYQLFVFPQFVPFTLLFHKQFSSGHWVVVIQAVTVFSYSTRHAWQHNLL